MKFFVGSVLVTSLCFSLAHASVVPRQYGGGYGYGDDGYGDSDAQPQSEPTSSTAVPAAPTGVPASISAADTSASAGPGDSKCLDLLCVSAIVNSNSTVTYVLQSTNKASLGWMAIGFGSQMADTPMVIMWPNPDGSVTLSQRQATGHIQPTVDPSPSRIASTVNSLTSATASNPILAFSVTANSDVQQSLIWAFGSSKPSGSAVDAQLQQHLDSGTIQLNLAGNSASFTPAVAVAANVAPSNTPASSSTPSQSVNPPLKPYQALLAAHAVLCSLGFIVLLPTGVLIARYLRVVSPNWFKGHAYTQFWISGPVIITGFILAIAGVGQADSGHFNDKHKLLGLVIILFYGAQCSLGAFIHWVKDPNRKSRPSQNYIHAIIGLAIIGLSFYQVHLGYDVEWRATTGRDDVPSGINKIWIAWVIVLTLGYFGGLGLLKKQFSQEKEASRSYKLGH